MPIYEYRCKECGQKNSFFEKKIGKKNFFLNIFFPKKCKSCGSRKLERVLSCSFVHRTQTTAEMLDELSKMAPINFVPDMRPKGPPPGGCPYEVKPSEEKKEDKKRERIIIS